MKHTNYCQSRKKKRKLPAFQSIGFIVCLVFCGVGKLYADGKGPICEVEIIAKDDFAKKLGTAGVYCKSGKITKVACNEDIARHKEIAAISTNSGFKFKASGKFNASGVCDELKYPIVCAERSDPELRVSNEKFCGY